MSDERLNEIDGRIEALTELVIEIADELDSAGVIEINDISATLRRNADSTSFHPAIASQARNALRVLADELQRRNRTLADR